MRWLLLFLYVNKRPPPPHIYYNTQVCLFAEAFARPSAKPFAKPFLASPGLPQSPSQSPSSPGIPQCPSQSPSSQGPPRKAIHSAADMPTRGRYCECHCECPFIHQSSGGAQAVPRIRSVTLAELGTASRINSVPQRSVPLTSFRTVNRTDSVTRPLHTVSRIPYRYPN